MGGGGCRCEYETGDKTLTNLLRWCGRAWECFIDIGEVDEW